MTTQKKKIVGRVSPDIHEKLLAVSQNAGVSQSVVLSVAIEEVFNKFEKKQKKQKSAAT